MEPFVHGNAEFEQKKYGLRVSNFVYLNLI